jgi:hypothetical protein
MATEPLTVEYLEGHRSLVHNYESFGRSIAELMIQEARRMALALESETPPSAAEFKADVIVAAIDPKGLGVELCVPSIGCVRVHVAPEG